MKTNTTRRFVSFVNATRSRSALRIPIVPHEVKRPRPQTEAKRGQAFRCGLLLHPDGLVLERPKV